MINENTEIKVVVACNYNANGEPDFYFCKIRCSIESYNMGDHYSLAERQAEKEGYSGKMVSFDEKDAAGKAIINHFVWDSASTFTI